MAGRSHHYRLTGRLFGTAIFALLLAAQCALAGGDRLSDYTDLRRMIGKGRFTEAIERCKQLMRIYPRDVQLYQTLPEVSLYASDLDNAERFFVDQIDRGDDIAWGYYGLGKVYKTQRHYQQAMQSFNDAIVMGLADPDCYREFVVAYNSTYGIEGTIRFFSEYCHRDPENSNCWYAFGEAYWIKMETEKAIVCFDESVLRNPAECKYHEAKAVAISYVKRTDSSGRLLRNLLCAAHQRGEFRVEQYLRSHLLLNLSQRVPLDSLRVEARLMFRQAEELGYFYWLGWAFNLIADEEWYAGERRAALDDAMKSLQASLASCDEGLLRASLETQLRCNRDFGTLGGALSCAFQLIHRSLSAKDKVNIAFDLSSTAGIYHQIGADDAGLSYALEAYGIAEEVGSNPYLSHFVECHLGTVYEGLNKYEVARNHYDRAWKLEPKATFWLANKAIVCGNIGHVLHKLGKFKIARQYLDLQLSLARQARSSQGEALSLACLGDYYFALREQDSSRMAYMKGLLLSRQFGFKPMISLCSDGIARLAQSLGDDDEAIKWYASSIDNGLLMGLDQIRALHISGSDAKIREAYVGYVQSLSRIGRVREAYENVEREKEQEQSSTVAVWRSALPPETPDSTRSRVTALRSELDCRRHVLAQEYRKASAEMQGRPSIGALSDVTASELELQMFMDSARVCDRRTFDSLYSSQGASRRLQTSRLGEDECILEYLVGEPQTDAFLLTRDTLVHAVVPAGREGLSRLLGNMAGVLRQGGKRKCSFNAALANFDVRSAAKLYTLLVGPFERFLGCITRIRIVPDDVLKALPFEALVNSSPPDTGSRNFSGAHFLLEKFEVSYLPTASFLNLPRHERVSGLNAILAVGDPLAPEANNETALAGGPLLRRGIGRATLEPLPGARREATRIKDVFGGNADILTGGDASKSNFLRMAGRYRILHIAAHASYDEKDPLFSSIFLSSDSGKREGGELQAFELLNLHLDAELAVLSSCNTGASGPGGQMQGGFVEGLMCGGVPSVITTLWDVDDEAGADLMEAFYRNLQRGERKSRALQLAKLELIKAGKADPFYWGGYVLIGESGPLDLSGGCERSRSIIYGGVAFLSVALIIVLLAKARQSRIAGESGGAGETLYPRQ